MRTAFVLMSGGIDSSTCFALALSEYEDVEGVSIDYGQRHKKEILFAQRQCHQVGVIHNTLDLSTIIPKTMLTDAGMEIPSVSYSDIEGVSPTYVPFRNGLMLSSIASYVVGKKVAAHVPADDEWGIYFGCHAEDALNWAYPDCTPEFTGAMANAIYVGTYHEVRLHTPLQWLGKKEIITLGNKLGVVWDETWSCYAGGERHCGVCPTCRARRQGFHDAAIYDPTEYENH